MGSVRISSTPCSPTGLAHGVSSQAVSTGLAALAVEHAPSDWAHYAVSGIFPSPSEAVFRSISSVIGVDRFTQLISEKTDIRLIVNEALVTRESRQPLSEVRPLLDFRGLQLTNWSPPSGNPLSKNGRYQTPMLHMIDFGGALLKGARLSGYDLNGCRFGGVDLSATHLDNAGFSMITIDSATRFCRHPVLNRHMLSTLGVTGQDSVSLSSAWSRIQWVVAMIELDRLASGFPLDESTLRRLTLPLFVGRPSKTDGYLSGDSKSLMTALKTLHQQYPDMVTINRLSILNKGFFRAIRKGDMGALPLVFQVAISRLLPSPTALSL